MKKYICSIFFLVLASFSAHIDGRGFFRCRLCVCVCVLLFLLLMFFFSMLTLRPRCVSVEILWRVGHSCATLFDFHSLFLLSASLSRSFSSDNVKWKPILNWSWLIFVLIQFTFAIYVGNSICCTLEMGWCARTRARAHTRKKEHTEKCVDGSRVSGLRFACLLINDDRNCTKFACLPFSHL